MYKICFYVPHSHVELVKNALFAKGAGKIGHYSHCAWQTLGEGQFLAENESHPFLGEKGRLEKVQEYKVELICEKKYLQEVLEALKKTHPYELPAYDVIKIENIF